MHGAGLVVAVEHDGRVGAALAQHGPAQRVGAGGVELDDASSCRPPRSSRRTTRSAMTAASCGSWVTRMAVVPATRRMPTDLAGEVVVEIAVEPGQRLVEQHEARRRRQRAGQRDPLGLAAAQLGDGATAEADEADELEHLGHPAGRSRLRSRRCIRNPNATLAWTSRWGNSCSSWNTMPMPRRCVGTAVMSRPSRSTVAGVGRERDRR